MRLTLTSAALPEASLDRLRRAARHRDLDALEVVVGAGHEHGVEAAWGVGTDDAETTPIGPEDPPVRWLLMEGAPSVAEVLYSGRQAALLEAGLLLRNAVPESPLGLPIGLVHGTDPEAAQEAAAWARMHDANTCWEVALGRRDPEHFSDVLAATAPTLAHVRLLGAGPEAQSEAPGTAGTGTVLKELALHGFSGTVALAPSDQGSLEDWREWLFEGRGWGCGTAAQKQAEREAATS